MDSSLPKPVRRRRSARRAERRRLLLHRLAFWACAVFLLLAVVGGFLTGRGWWSTGRADALLPDSPATTDQRSAALRLLDEAVTARHEERLQGAVNAIAEARRLFPELPGLDLFIGEVAWESRDAETVRRAADAALERGHSESSAKLLLALEKYMTRSSQDTAALGETVRQLLAEAEEAGLSNAAPFFFHGEVSRLLADGEEAHRKLLGALHRQMPWVSASLLEIKLQLAAAEATDLGRPVVAPAPTDAADAVLQLRNSLLAAGDVRGPLTEMLAVSPALQTGVLLQDAALSGSGSTPSLEEVHKQTRPAVPHQNLLRPQTF